MALPPVVGPVLFGSEAAPALVTANNGITQRSLGSHTLDVINVLDFGAVPDGVTDNMAAVQNAINTALSVGIQKILFPHGTYNFPNTTTSQLDPGAGNLDFVGDGKYSTTLKFTGGTAAPGTGKGLFYNTSGSATALKGYLSFRDMAIQGSFLDATPQQNQGNVGVYCDFYSGLYFQGVRFYAMNFMAIDCHFIPQVIVDSCEFDTVSRDMLRVINAFNATITGNVFRHGGDDAIALHTATASSGPGLIREGITITGNVFEDTSRVAVLGARMVNISNNVMRRCHAGIAASVDANEGANQIFGVQIIGNHLYDLNVLSGSNTFQSISVTPWVPRAGTTPATTNGVPPGDPAITSGTIALPFNYRNTNTNTATDALAHSFAVKISDNVICRTLQAADGSVSGFNTYSDWGYGLAMTSTGFVNPAMTTAMLTQSVGIQVDGSTIGLSIKDNYVADCGTGVFLGTTLSTQSGLWIEGNHFYNITSAGILGNNASLSNTIGRIAGNIFNLDPFLLNANRLASGAWSAATGCVGISASQALGLVIADNVFQNVSNPTTVNQTLNIFSKNKIRAQWVSNAGGYSVANLGVGLIYASGEGWIYENVQFSAGSSGYNGLFNACPLDDVSAGMPTTGSWIRGHFIRSQNPLATNALGWSRLTSGGGNVIGTDWLPVALAGGLRNATLAYTLVAADNGRTIVLNSASSVSITVPSGLGVTFQVGVVQTGAGKVTFTTSGTTINAKIAFVSGTTGVSAQYGEAKLRAYLADTFVLTGDIS